MIHPISQIKVQKDIFDKFKLDIKSNKINNSNILEFSLLKELDSSVVTSNDFEDLSFISWTFNITSLNSEIIYNQSGNTLPFSISWNPVNIDNKPIEGNINLNIVLNLGEDKKIEKRIDGFFVDFNGPTNIRSNLSSQIFTPDGDNVNDTVDINFLGADDNSGIKSWDIQIYDPVGNLFYQLKDMPPNNNKITWNGKSNLSSSTNELVQAASRYRYNITARDNSGNEVVSPNFYIKVEVLDIFDTSIQKYKIPVPSITFIPNEENLVFDNSPEGITNKQVLDSISTVLKNYQDTTILIWGHASSTHPKNSQLAIDEEANELIPLSTQRALEVRRQLILRGVNGDILIAEGKGGSYPIVPYNDDLNRWKNRRVEFIINR